MSKSKNKIKNMKELKNTSNNQLLIKEYSKGTKLIEIFRMQSQYLKFPDFLNFLMSILTEKDKENNKKNSKRY